MSTESWVVLTLQRLCKTRRYADCIQTYEFQGIGPTVVFGNEIPDLTSCLIQVYVRWPDNGLWYGATISKARPNLANGCYQSISMLSASRDSQRSFTDMLRVLQLNLKTLDAKLSYEETGEEENTNLGTLVKDGDLALSKPHAF